MAVKEKTLSDAFYETLKDVYWAEKQSVKACKKSAKEAKSGALKDAFATGAGCMRSSTTDTGSSPARTEVA